MVTAFLSKLEKRQVANSKYSSKSNSPEPKGSRGFIFRQTVQRLTQRTRIFLRFETVPMIFSKHDIKTVMYMHNSVLSCFGLGATSHGIKGNLRKLGPACLVGGHSLDAGKATVFVEFLHQLWNDILPQGCYYSLPHPPPSQSFPSS